MSLGALLLLACGEASSVDSGKPDVQQAEPVVEACDAADNDGDGAVDEGALLTFVPDAGGEPQELGGLLAEDGPTAIGLSESGVLRVCQGRHLLRLRVAAPDVRIEGLGGPDGVVLDAASSGSVLSFAGSGALDVSGVTLTGGSATYGGGLLAVGTDAASIHLEDVVIEANHATLDGAGMHATRVELVLDRVVVQGNHAGNNGGGAWVRGLPAFVATSTSFVDNEAEDEGGALRAFESNLTWDDVVVHDNRATTRGGGLSVDYDCAATISEAEITWNESRGSGGGLFVDGDTVLVMKDSVVDDNTALTGGGVHVRDSSRVSLAGVSLRRNYGTSRGGAVYVYDSCAELDASELHGNVAFLGGGVFIDSGDLETVGNSWGTGEDANDPSDIACSSGETATGDLETFPCSWSSSNCD